jgi:hypothetical protein
MRHSLWISLLFFASFAAGQNCTSYIVVGAFEHGSGDDIDNLNARDFQARMNGRDLPVVSVAQNFSSRLLVLVETDGTRREKIEDVVNTVTQLARRMPQGKPIAFGAFARRAIFTKDFSVDPEERNTAINEIREQSESLGKEVSLFDSLHEAIAKFGDHRPGDTILLVADPYDDNSHHSASDIEKELLHSGTRLLVVLREHLSRVARDDFMWKSHEREKQFFSDMTARTGGAYTDFNAHFLATFAWRGYLLGLQMPDNFNKPHKWKLKLGGGAAESYRKPVLYYPEQLLPCSSGNAERAAAP